MGLIIVLICLTVVIGLFVWSMFLQDYERIGILFPSITGLFVVVALAGSSYYMHIVSPEEEIKCYEITIASIKNTIDENKVLNMKDNEIGKSLAVVIVEYENYKKGLRIAKKNPFTIFKPVLSVD